MKREKTSDRGTVIWNYFGTVFNMGISFLLLPFLLLFLSGEELGVWYVMLSFSNFANLFSFGFTPAFARNVAYCWNGARSLEKTGKKEDAKINGGVDYYLLKKVLMTSRYLYLMFALTGTLAITVFGTLHIWRIAKEVLNPSIEIGWLIFLIAIFLNIYYGYYTSYLVGIGRVKESSQITVIAGIVRIVIMAVTMYLGFGISGAAFAYLANGIVQRISGKIVFYHTAEMKQELDRIRDKKISFREMKACFQVIWYNAWRDGIVSVAEYLSTQMGTIVCSSFLSLENTAVFSLTTQLVTAIGKIAKSIHNAYTPVFQKAYIVGDRKTERETQAFCVFAYTLVYVLGILALVTIGIPIIRLIKPDISLSAGLILGYGVYQFMLSYRNCYGAYLSCTNRLWYWKSYIITSFAVVLTYTALLSLAGGNVWWIVLSSIFCEGVYNFWKWPGLVNRELELKLTDIVCLGMKGIRRLLKNERDSKEL